MTDFKNKVALVTAAAAGIGAATAEAYANAGAKVMLSDIENDAGEAQAQRLRDSGADAKFIRADATVEEDVERLVRETVETFGGLNYAANIVGAAHLGSMGPEFHKQELSAWEWTQNICLRSVFLCMKYQISHMIDHGGGAITNVASTAGIAYVPDAGASYAVAKAGVIKLTKFAAISYADKGIRVNCIAPGTTVTDGLAQAESDLANVTERFLAQHAIKRPVRPWEQAAGILWLNSDNAAMVTGHILPIDGGWTAK